MTHSIRDIGIAKQIGSYSVAIETAPNFRGPYTSGTPGLAASGDLPDDITGQAELAGAHVVRMLKLANMTLADLVKVTQYLTSAQDITAYAKVRKRFLNDVRSAFMLLVVPQRVRPEFLLEIEVIAASRETSRSLPCRNTSYCN